MMRSANSIAISAATFMLLSAVCTRACAQKGRTAKTARTAIRTASLQAPAGKPSPPVVAPGWTTTVELTTRNMGSGETPLGDLVADSLRSAGKADIAFIAASSFDEATIPKGSFVPADVVKSLEFGDDTVAVVKLTGSQIEKALRHSLTLFPKENSGFLQMSGLTVTVSVDATMQSHVVSVKVGSAALEIAHTYLVAMPTPLANGALAYFKVWPKSAIDHETTSTLSGAITTWLAGHHHITRFDPRLVTKP
ncbi:MAG: 5'-nucleotidase C-terminal domain-containing protein [Armatimonadetes bacterium]|nr:5'-nucleotidase C-terminal domain-containing protein [Armatimonadota bacterium]MDE2205238.1 5'-nucleotidase C-terminal domain-containing protein [Armatimonadota bacterium]